ncbi:MAG: hypothetical protein A2X55_08925 [Nitrospirae bacterium GWB2_47_37]|nr:MAG: hypothetical protein A2X55_08925 [Nitrospirae bacterium GWB2_47_37]HAK87634.1 hypothetical protein [Nitrospiraceae bacterium]
MKYIQIAILLIVIIIAAPVMADIDNMLDNVVSGVYVQEPGVYKSPSSATMSLGSVSFRLKNDVLGKPAFSVTPPRAAISCSGMDFDAGMISMLNLDVFEQLLSQGGASLSWGIMIGMVYSLPGVSESWQKLQEYARLGQKIFQSPCEMGKLIGADIGAKIWDKEAAQKSSQKVTDGTTSVFAEAMKKIAKHLEVGDFVQTFPYGSLQKAGITDKDIQDLLASWFGILDIWLLDNNGNRISSSDLTKKLDTVCGEQCGPDNVGHNFKVRLLTNINALMHGGKMELYSCSGGITGNSCDGGISRQEKSVIGLKKKISDKLKNLRYNLKDSTGSELKAKAQDASNFTSAVTGEGTGGLAGSEIFAFAQIAPNFFDVMNYSSILSKSTDPSVQQTADKIIENTAEFLSLQLIMHIAKQAYEAVGNSIGSDNKVIKGVPAEMFNVYRNSIEEGVKATSAYVKDINDIYQTHINAYDRYKGLKIYANDSVVKNFGEGVRLFKK